MSQYKPILDGEIAVGKPVSSTTLNTVKENFKSHHERIEDLEGGEQIDWPPIIFRVNGPYEDISIPGRIDYLRTTSRWPIRIIGVRLLIDQAGSSPGSITEIDLLSNSSGSFVSIMSSKPSVSQAAGDDAISANGGVNPDHDVLMPGDVLRMDITSVQGGNPKGFMVRIDYRRTNP